MFIELRRDGKRILVNTMWIDQLSEKYSYIGFGGSEETMGCDETYDEIKEMIKKVELVVGKENV